VNGEWHGAAAEAFLLTIHHFSIHHSPESSGGGH
jgi:hypothetical protein